MPYHVYTPWIRENVFAKNPNPSILEIGVDVGQTLLPIMNYFSVTRGPYKYVGLDIRRDENLCAILGQCLMLKDQNISYLKENSLSWLPKCEDKFDLILIDGDHNYHTVFEELKHIDNLLAPGGHVICDDYEGRWSERDLYYSTRDTHNDLELGTEFKDTQKKGVKNAIDDFLEENSDKWIMARPIRSEAVVLTRYD